MPKTIKKRDINRRAVGEDALHLENFQEKMTGFMEHRRTAVLQVVLVLVLVAAAGIGISVYMTSTRNAMAKLEADADRAFQYVPQSENEDETKHLQEAADLYGKAAAAGKSPYSSFQLGLTRMKLAEFDEAVTAFQQFIQQYGSTPLAPLARIQIARIKVVQGKPEEALEVLGPAFKDPVAGDTALMLAAEILDRVQRPDEAQTRRQEIVDRFPSSSWALEAKARIAPPDEKVPQADSLQQAPPGEPTGSGTAKEPVAPASPEPKASSAPEEAPK